MSARTGYPATKTRTLLRSGGNLIVFSSLPSARTCFKRSFLCRQCYFSFTCALGFFNHTSVTKQTNKFRAYAADTNIDMSYEIERAREKALGPNAQHLHQTSRASLYKVLPPAVTHLCLWSHVEAGSGKGRGGQTRIKLSLLAV